MQIHCTSNTRREVLSRQQCKTASSLYRQIMAGGQKYPEELFMRLPLETLYRM